MPARQIRLAAMRSIGRLSNCIRPRSAGKGIEVMTLKRVLLPLPFGPAMPKISPLRTEKETSSTARSSPKDLQAPSTMRMSFIVARRRSRRGRDRRGRLPGRRRPGCRLWLLHPLRLAEVAGLVFLWREQHALAIPYLIEGQWNVVVGLLGEMGLLVEHEVTFGDHLVGL